MNNCDIGSVQIHACDRPGDSIHISDVGRYRSDICAIRGNGCHVRANPCNGRYAARDPSNGCHIACDPGDSLDRIRSVSAIFDICQSSNVSSDCGQSRNVRDIRTRLWVAGCRVKTENGAFAVCLERKLEIREFIARVYFKRAGQLFIKLLRHDNLAIQLFIYRCSEEITTGNKVCCALEKAGADNC